jgi:phosphomannomutase
VTPIFDVVCEAYVPVSLHAVVSQANRIVLGCNLQPSNPSIAQSCAASFKAAGSAVLFANPFPTPALTF